MQKRSLIRSITRKPFRLTTQLLPSPAVVLASLALVISLGGTAYAAATLSRNSVGEIHLKDGAVTSAKVRDASLRAVDLAPATRGALRGPAGPAGPAGPTGAAGPPGISGLEVIGASSPFDSSRSKTVVVACPAGKRLVGAGAGAWGRAMIWMPEGVVLTANHPLDERTWLAGARELTPTDQGWFLRANALCVAA